MQKLKKVFSPGNDKDDEQMYGTPAARKEASQNSPGAGSAASPTTSQGSHPTSEGKEHGITRQILNPDGAKYDEQRYGTSTTAGSQPPVTRQEEAALAARMGEPKDDNGVKRQVLHPESNKPDETGYGETGFTGSEHKPHGTDYATGTSSKPNELGYVPPSNEKYDTTGVAPGTALSTNERTVAPDTASRMSVKSGVLGSSDQRTTDRALGSDGITGQAAPTQTESSHSGRNMALAGATAAAGAGGAYAATRPHDQGGTSGDRDVENATYTDRSFPLAGGTTTHEDAARPPSSTYSTQAAGPSSTSAYIDPATSSSTNTKDAGGLGHGSGTAAIAGAGAGAGAGVTSADVGEQLYADHSKHSHKFVGDPCEAAPQDPTFVPGPHHTVAANMLDPHIPGEFPREDGTDPHGQNPLLGAGLPPQQSESSATQEPFTGNTSGTAAERPSQEHHYARDAALAGGAGAAGLGAYAATRDHGDSARQTQPQDYSSTSASTQQPQTGLTQQTSTQQSVAGDPLTGSREPEKEHHYGRDAALAGGAGAAGYGAYKLAGDRDNSSAAPQTTAPRESTTGVLNEPVRRDVSDPVLSNDKDHHYGRDAALAGGAGTAGYGAYKLADDRNEPATAPRHTTANTLNEPTQSTLPDRTVSQQQQEPQDNHYGRNAALAGGAGAAGYGAYELSKDREQPSTSSPSNNAMSPTQSSTTTTTTTTTTSSSSPRHKSALLNKLDPRVDSSAAKQEQEQQQPQPSERESHTGRNAALGAGAAGAAGAGYAAYSSNDDPTGPASKTIGPHSSNAANIVDPRVQPEPEKMKEHSTAGPWQSDSLNKLDPKVQSDPAKADVKQHGYASGVPAQQTRSREDEEKEHHYGRDAAVVGGAGAAAYGGKQVYDQHEEEKLAKEQAKEQERLAKEQEKQAKHDAKEQEKQAKETEKQAKHDADEAAKAKKKEAEKAEKERQKEHEKMEKERQKEAEKQAKHDAKEQEKLEKERSKEAEKQAKHDAKEQEKLEKERSREEEKAEKERAKLAEKQEKEKEKEDERLAAAREEEAAKKHHEHNKLHKDPPEEREKKGGFIHRIFHHKAYDREGSEGARGSGSFEEGERPRSLETQNVDDANHARTAQALEGERSDGAGVGQGAYGQQASGQQGYGQTADGQGLAGGRDDGIVTEKTTGLPMNVGQYGSGAGGTDGGQHIHGYETK